jgi:hypothetical protein
MVGMTIHNILLASHSLFFFFFVIILIIIIIVNSLRSLLCLPYSNLVAGELATMESSNKVPAFDGMKFLQWSIPPGEVGGESPDGDRPECGSVPGGSVHA